MVLADPLQCAGAPPALVASLGRRRDRLARVGVAAVLGDVHTGGLDLGDAQVLKDYEEWRALDALMVMGATDGLTRLFGIPGRSASAVRRMGMAGIQRLPVLKRFFMDEARAYEQCSGQP